MLLTRALLGNQFRRDPEFRLVVLTFVISSSVALVCSALPLNIHLSCAAVVALAIYICSPWYNVRPIFTIQSSFIGWIFGLCSYLLFSLSTAYSCLILYVIVMCIFHITEFLFTAITNRRTLMPDSFLLNHSRQYWMAACACCGEYLLEVYLFPSIKNGYMGFIGFCVCICGELLRKTAMVHAGVGFTHRLALSKRPDHRLVTSGIYSYIRHPGYTGWFLWSIGSQIVACNPVCFVLYGLASWMFFNERIYDEERDLIHFFGDQYMAYQSKVWIGIPFVSGFRLDS